MSTEQNKAIVRSFFEEVYNKGNLDLIDTIFSPDYRGLPAGGHTAHGPGSVRHTVTTMRHAFPDIHFTVEDIVAEGDNVVIHMTFRGTHRGAFLGIPPTGRQVEVEGAELARLAGGQIVEAGWQLHDMLGLLRQLGVIMPGHHGGGFTHTL